MPPAAIVAGAAAAIGIGGAATAAATGAGKSRYTAQTFNQSNQYDPSAYQYGGTPGGADNAANTAGGNMNNFLNVAGADQAAAAGQIGNQWNDRNTANGVQATTAADRGLAINQQGVAAQDRGVAGQSRNLSLQSRGAQGQILGMQLQRAAGHNLIANQQADIARRNLASSIASQKASARGPAALANAGSDAMAAQAQGLAGINQQTTAAAQQEQQANEAAASQTATGMRTGDLALNSQDQGQQGQDISLLGQQIGQQNTDIAQQGQDIAQQGQDVNAINAYNNAANAAGNTALGFGNLQNNIRTEQGTLASHGADQSQLSFAQKQAIDSGTAANNAQQDMNYIKMATGAVSGGAQGAAAAMPAAAPSGGTPPVAAAEHGGPVAGGKPVLVGEKGPELMVPKQDSIVIPAPQTLALLHDAERRTPAPKHLPTAEELMQLANELEKRERSESVVAREEGGPVKKDQAALVGEKGPELVVAPPGPHPLPEQRSPVSFKRDDTAQYGRSLRSYDTGLGLLRGAASPGIAEKALLGPASPAARVLAGLPIAAGGAIGADAAEGKAERKEEAPPVASRPAAPEPESFPKAETLSHTTGARTLSVNGRRREGPAMNLAIASPETADAAAPHPHPLPAPKAPPIQPPKTREPIAFKREQPEPEPEEHKMSLSERLAWLASLVHEAGMAH